VPHVPLLGPGKPQAFPSARCVKQPSDDARYSSTASCRPQIRMPKIIALPQHRLALLAGQRVGEAVAEVQIGRLSREPGAPVSLLRPGILLSLTSHLQPNHFLLLQAGDDVEEIRSGWITLGTEAGLPHCARCPYHASWR